MSPNQERSSNAWIIGCLGATGVIVAAIIALGTPFAERLADIYFPPTTPTILPATQSVLPSSPSNGSPPSSNSPGQCASDPVNPNDNIEVQLDPTRWYLTEEYDNETNPPLHTFRAQMGTISVIANANRGTRAWECTGESDAISQAQLIATQYKQDHPREKVIGPYGEVK